MITEEQIRGSIKGQLKSNAAICQLKCVRLTITDKHNKKGHKLYQNIINSLRLIFFLKIMQTICLHSSTGLCRGVKGNC